MVQKRLTDVNSSEIRTAEELAKEQRHVSISEFFEKNRHLLGYDNLSKALLTVVKEAVDNSIDACEEAKIIPEVSVEIKPAGENRFKVVVEDNGPGIIKQNIAKVFATLLFGSKFHRLRQSRGIQGIGVSAAVLYAQLTTGKSTKIISKTSSKKQAHFVDLHIDVKKNEAEIIEEKDIDWEKSHGTRIELEIEAKYQKGRQSVDEYLKQTAIVNPSLRLIYNMPDNQRLEFPRGADKLPVEAKEIKPHPYGIELGMLINMLKNTSAKSVHSFLINDFSRISPKVAKELCGKAQVNDNEKPRNISRDQADKIMQAIKQTRIMAPPTNCLSPIGEDLLVKGLQKEINADFYASVTRPPSVYRGMPFLVECCSGDTNIYLEDGNIVTIKDYIEKNMSQKVFSMNQKLKIVPSKVFMSHKFKNKHKILKIITRTGKELKLTSNNKVPIIENGMLIWKNTGDVMAGDFIATPRSYKVFGKIPHLLEILDPNHVKILDKFIIRELMRKLKAKYGNYKIAASELSINYGTFKAYRRPIEPSRPTLAIFRKIIDELGLNFDELKNSIHSIRIVDTKFTNPKRIKLANINEDFLYLLGLLESDGYISRKNIQFVNNDQSLHDAFYEKMKILFGLKVKQRNNSSGICNKSLYIILKKVSELLPMLPDNLIIAWLKGMVDGDGWVSVSEDKIKIIGIATAKKEKAKFAQTMLLRLGILSKIEEQGIPKKCGMISGRLIKTKHVKYYIIIGNTSDIQKFYSIISFRQKKRANLLSTYITKCIKIKSPKDIIPLGGENLVKFREQNNLFQYQLGFSDQTIRQVEKGKQNLTRLGLQQICKNDYAGEIFQQLKLLAFSDIYWDKIVNIELMPHEDYVYDLTVETGNFVANNIIMHNCSAAYGGNMASDELIRLMRFANKVPLLYQQSACAITKSIINTAWNNYGLSQSRGALPSAPVVLVVHIASVWVPFTSESKEAVAHYPEIIKEIKLALQEIGRKIAGYVRKNIKSKEQRERVDLFEKYIPELAGSLSSLSGEAQAPIEAKLKAILKKGLKDLLAGITEGEKE